MTKRMMQAIFPLALCLLALCLPKAGAQLTTVTHNPTFTTTNQSWYKPGTSPNQLKNYLLGGLVKGFADESVGDDDYVALSTKMGVDVDVFTDVTLPAEGKVDVTFPARVTYSYPSDRTYGCGEIAIVTTCAVNPGYNLNSRPPVMDIEFGVKAKAGLFLEVESFFGDATVANEPAGFNMATLANYESLMAGGEQTLLRYHTTNGVAIASENWISGLPVTIPFLVSFPTKLSGSLSNAFENNPSDVINGKIISEDVTKQFMDLDYDPIQYSTLITGVTLKVTAPIPSVGKFSATLLSVPLHFDVFQSQKLTFDPNLDIRMVLNRNYQYRVKDENDVVVQTGTGNLVTMRAGHTLLLTVPSDNQPITVTPTYRVNNNEFTTEINYITNVSASVEMFAASAETESIEICDPTPLDLGCVTFGPYSIGFGPLVNFPIHIDNAVSDLYPATTFSMGGFQDIPGGTLTLVPDDAPPVLTFLNPTLELDVNGQVTVDFRYRVADNIRDVDGGEVIVVDEPTVVYDCADIGPAEYVFTLSDDRCNQRTFHAPLTIVDRIPPTISCPLPIVRYTDPGTCATVVTYTTPAYWDNCANATLSKVSGPASGASLEKGTYEAIWKVVQSTGTLMAQCTVNIVVVDNIAPTVACPPTQTRSTAPGQCNALLTYNNPTAADNCTPAPTTMHVSGGTGTAQGASTSSATFAKGTTTVQWKATDGVGLTKTCTFRVVVNDVEAPAITCPSPIAANTAPGQCTAAVTYANPSFTDNCAPTSGTAVRISGPASGANFPLGNTNVVFQATDASGNTKRCTMTVTVTDDQLPTIQCPPPISVAGDGNPCVATVIYANPTASDNCAGPGGLVPFLLTGLASGSVFPAGVTTNTWRALAANGQTADCSFDVTVNCAPLRGIGTEDRAAAAETRNPKPETRLFPNPAAQEAWLDLSAHEGLPCSVRLLDTRGVLAQQHPVAQTTAAGLFRLGLDGLPTGLYFVQVQVPGQRVEVLKLVVERR